MSETPQILTYTRGDHSALCTFMSELQDLEREWSNDRAPGPEMAADHIDYLLDLAQRSDGQALVAKLDTNWWVSLLLSSSLPMKEMFTWSSDIVDTGWLRISMLPKRQDIKALAEA